MSRRIQIVFLLFKKFLSYLVSHQPIEFSIQKSIVKIILSQTPLSATTGQNTSVGIGLIEFTKSSNTLN